MPAVRFGGAGSFGPTSLSLRFASSVVKPASEVCALCSWISFRFEGSISSKSHNSVTRQYREITATSQPFSVKQPLHQSNSCSTAESVSTCASTASGKATKKVDPSPSTDSNQMRPPWRSTNSRQR